MKKKYLTEEEMEREQFENELLTNRFSEQRQKNDYDYDEEGKPERCDDCGAFINSNGHCPRCDY